MQLAAVPSLGLVMRWHRNTWMMLTLCNKAPKLLPCTSGSVTNPCQKQGPCTGKKSSTRAPLGCFWNFERRHKKKDMFQYPRQPKVLPQDSPGSLTCLPSLKIAHYMTPKIAIVAQTSSPKRRSPSDSSLRYSPIPPRHLRWLTHQPQPD